MNLTRTHLIPKACPDCKSVLGAEAFAPSVWLRTSGRCRACQSRVDSNRKLRVARTPKSAIRCPRCEETKGQEAFTPSVWVRGNGQCKPCHNAYYGSAASNGARRKGFAQYTQARRKRLVEMVTEHKAQLGCRYCEESHPAALDLHHLNPSLKVATVRQLCDRGVRAETLLAEMAKCEVVCSNCHRKLHAGITLTERDRRSNAPLRLLA